MKEDYLWDKTGSDAEIEELENSLKAFRSKNTAAPDLPQKTFALDKTSMQNAQPRRFSLRFAFAAFACVAFVITSFGIFQVLNFSEQDFAKNSDDKSVNEPKAKSSTDSEIKPILKDEVVKQAIAEKTTKPIIVKETTKRNIQTQPQIIKTRKRVKRTHKTKFVAKRIRRKSKSTKPKIETVKLTKEEKDAYDQLMQALSITGTQMKIVQEGINGVKEEKTAVKKDSR